MFIKFFNCLVLILTLLTTACSYSGSENKTFTTTVGNNFTDNASVNKHVYIKLEKPDLNIYKPKKDNINITFPSDVIADFENVFFKNLKTILENKHYNIGDNITSQDINLKNSYILSSLIDIVPKLVTLKKCTKLIPFTKPNCKDAYFIQVNGGVTLRVFDSLHQFVRQENIDFYTIGYPNIIECKSENEMVDETEKLLKNLYTALINYLKSYNFKKLINGRYL
jgi:hypothetical protein